MAAPNGDSSLQEWKEFLLCGHMDDILAAYLAEILEASKMVCGESWRLNNAMVSIKGLILDEDPFSDASDVKYDLDKEPKETRKVIMLAAATFIMMMFRQVMRGDLDDPK